MALYVLIHPASPRDRRSYSVRPLPIQVSDAAKQSAQKAQYAAEDAADAVGGLTSGLTEQQKNIGKIIVGLILFQVLIGAIGSAFSGGGASYSV